MSFESSVLPYARAVLPQEVMECYAFERDHGAGNVDALTPECREAWIIFHCLKNYYQQEYPDWKCDSLSAPSERSGLEQAFFENLAQWHLSILALIKAQSSSEATSLLYAQLASREIEALHNTFNGLTDTLPGE